MGVGIRCYSSFSVRSFIYFKQQKTDEILLFIYEMGSDTILIKENSIPSFQIRVNSEWQVFGPFNGTFLMVARYNRFSLSRDTTSHVKTYSQFIQMFNLQFPLLECEKALRVTWLHSSEVIRMNCLSLGIPSCGVQASLFMRQPKIISRQIIAVCSVR